MILERELNRLLVLARQFPDVEILIKMRGTSLTVGIEKGAQGDLLAAAWGNPMGEGQTYTSVGADQN